jgi:predicted PurR-regulated permease PerM
MWAADLRPRGLSTSITALTDSLEETLRPAPPDPDEVVEVGLTVAEAVVSVVTVLALVFFWLLEHARIQRFVLAFLPSQRRGGAREAWNEIENRLGLWVRGQLILMASIGVATGVVYTAIGLPSAMLLALIAAITEAIPIVGPLIGAIPAILVAATVSPETAVLVAAIYLLIQLVEGNVLVPLVMRNTIGISPFLVLVSLLVGGAAGGLIGALFGVPVAAAVVVVLERLQAREVPVQQDPGGVEDVSPEEAKAMRSSLPDAAAR